MYVQKYVVENIWIIFTTKEITGKSDLSFTQGQNEGLPTKSNSATFGFLNGLGWYWDVTNRPLFVF